MRLVTLILLGWVALSVLGYVALEVMAWWYSRSARKTWGREPRDRPYIARNPADVGDQPSRPQDDPSWFMADLIERTVKPK